MPPTVTAARSNFRDSLLLPEAGTGKAVLLGNVEVHVLDPGTDPDDPGDRAGTSSRRRQGRSRRVGGPKSPRRDDA